MSRAGGGSVRAWALVNNAGVASAANLDWAPVDLFRKTMEVNVFGK